VHRASKIIAWECLRQTYRPSTARREEILAALGGEDAKALISFLESKMLLIQTVGPAKNRLGFALDPLAEYLAAMYIVESYKDDEVLWRSFLTRADEVSKGSTCISGFLLAIRDCCLTIGIEAGVPEFLQVELEKRAEQDKSIPTDAIAVTVQEPSGTDRA
jgi:hypothetical protein